jgi:hypothetical protein
MVAVMLLASVVLPYITRKPVPAQATSWTRAA